MNQETYLIRFSGELSIKAKKTRNRFTNVLVKCIADALRSEGVEYKIERSWAHLLVHADSAAEAVLQRVFGISSISRLQRFPYTEMKEILDHGEEIFAPLVEGKTFAVKTRRSDKKLPFRSKQIDRELGSRLYPQSAGVDLKNPEVFVQVDISQDEVKFLAGRIVGASGFPIGTEGRAVALVSGGFDSIVAAWRMLRRGTKVDYVFCNLGGAPHRESALRALQTLRPWSYGYEPWVHVIEFQPLVEELKKACPAPLWQVVLKRQMLRAAEIVARGNGANALVTGEAIGQVSSQTLPNLSVISQATEYLVLRPLLSANKEEIVEQAGKIGSRDLCAVVPEYCALHPKNPSTSASRSKVEKAEISLDRALLDEMVNQRIVLDLRTFDLDRVQARELEIAEIPEDAEIVDLRSKNAFASWHYPGSVRRSYFETLHDSSEFNRSKKWIFYCEIGLKSAHVAESLRREGVDAFHFKGGLKEMIRYSEREDPALRTLLSPVLLD